ncbi:hypothetical protein [Halorhabdus amylolytica]|uniref:hypothetical protein n=1 Tax=Halorhabdus amylolytica TaxID=2559573 RepID=UPI0010AB3EE6|nr:hypothetical protein [Halorhabdus amylolytica]
MSSYQPGACNIGPDQRRRRLAVAVAAFALATAQVVATVLGWLPDPVLVGVFVPLAIGFEWGLQAHTAFCVRLALLGRYDFRGAGGTSGEIDDPNYRRADDVQAAKLAVAGVTLSALTTAAVVLAV